jgi:hypothetical protein
MRRSIVLNLPLPIVFLAKSFTSVAIVAISVIGAPVVTPALHDGRENTLGSTLR